MRDIYLVRTTIVLQRLDQLTVGARDIAKSGVCAKSLLIVSEQFPQNARAPRYMLVLAQRGAEPERVRAILKSGRRRTALPECLFGKPERTLFEQGTTKAGLNRRASSTA